MKHSKASFFNPPLFVPFRLSSSAPLLAQRTCCKTGSGDCHKDQGGIPGAPSAGSRLGASWLYNMSITSITPGQLAPSCPTTSLLVPRFQLTHLCRKCLDSKNFCVSLRRVLDVELLQVSGGFLTRQMLSSMPTREHENFLTSFHYCQERTLNCALQKVCGTKDLPGNVSQLCTSSVMAVITSKVILFQSYLNPG